MSLEHYYSGYDSFDNVCPMSNIRLLNGKHLNIPVLSPVGLMLDVPFHVVAIPFLRPAIDRMKAENNSNLLNPVNNGKKRK